jgi:hypothetical protein
MLRFFINHPQSTDNKFNKAGSSMKNNASHLNWIILFLGLFISSSIQAQTAKAKSAHRYLFWHLTARGDADELAVSTMERALRQYFIKRVGGTLMDDDLMDTTLLRPGNEKILACGLTPSCLQKIGKLAQVDYVISASLNVMADKNIQMVLVETQTADIISDVDLSVSTPPSDEILQECYVAMFEPNRRKGAIKLQTDVAGANVFLNGKLVGVTPIKTIKKLTLGDHLLEIKKSGHQTYSRLVNVSRGKTIVVQAGLLPGGMDGSGIVPFYEKWPFWTASGLGLVSFIIAGVKHNTANGIQANLDVCDSDGFTPRYCQNKYGAADSSYTQAYIFYAIGGAGLITSLVIAALPNTGMNKKTNKVSVHLTTQGVMASWKF